MPQQVTPPQDTTRVISWAAFREVWDRQRSGRSHPVRSVTTSIAVLCWVVALVLVFLSWNGAAERIFVAEQVPYLISGAVSALLLTLIGSTVFLYGAVVDRDEPCEGSSTDGNGDGHSRRGR